MDDVLINKIAIIQRSLKRINQVYLDVGTHLTTDYTRQDSIILNLQRVCEASIDLANHITKQKRLGIPQSSRDSFNILLKAGLLSEDVTNNLKKMVGLRNIALHNYQELNLDTVKFIIENHLVDFQYFIRSVKSISLI